jgi:prophage regulatory protein
MERTGHMQQPQTGGDATYLLKVKDVQRRTQLSRATLYAYIRAGRFPAPVRLGRHSRWVEGEVQQYISALMAARNPAQGRANHVI